MTSLNRTQLSDRGILRVSGADSRDFLQGLISNDIHSVSAERAIYAALLTPQGKYLFDFFVAEVAGQLLIDCEKARIGDLMKRLRIYKLRADVELADETERWTVHSLWGDDAARTAGFDGDAGAARAIGGGVLMIDPRLAEAGLRAILPVDANAEPLTDLNATETDASHYDEHRLRLGLPDVSRDLQIDKSILIESGFDELNGIDWNKGCYMGQELTARTKYRGLVKKRLVPVTIDGAAPEAGAEIMLDGKSVGEMRSSIGNVGLALLRLEPLQEGAGNFECGAATLHPQKPQWAVF